jgi:hypothetical protein
VLANRRSSAHQGLTSVIEIQDLLINMGTKKILIGFRAVRNTDEMRARLQRLYMVDLTRHAIEECLFSVLRRRPYVNCVHRSPYLSYRAGAVRAARISSAWAEEKAAPAQPLSSLRLSSASSMRGTSFNLLPSRGPTQLGHSATKPSLHLASFGNPNWIMKFLGCRTHHAVHPSKA